MTPTRVCVFAGSGPGADPAYAATARELGGALAARGVGLVFGGSSTGLMGEVADAALAAGGEVIGVLPAAMDRREIGHRGLSELRIVGSMHERKATMAELSDAFVALPGGLGTLEELLEVATWTQLGIHAKPVGVLSPRGYWDDLRRLLDHAVRERFVPPENRDLITFDRAPAALLDRLEHRRPAIAGPEPELPPRGPLVGVSAVVVRGGAVLLGRRHGAHGAGQWSFPGGAVEPGETAAAAAARELAEETGLVARTAAPLTWTDDVAGDRHDVTLHHLVDADGDPATDPVAMVDNQVYRVAMTLPAPLFGPTAALVRTGWRPPGI